MFRDIASNTEYKNRRTYTNSNGVERDSSGRRVDINNTNTDNRNEYSTDRDRYGHLVDRHGRRINSRGRLVDRYDRNTDEYGRRVDRYDRNTDEYGRVERKTRRNRSHNYYNFLSKNNNTRLNKLLTGSQPNSNEMNDNNVWNNATAEPSCLDYAKDECVAPDCKWDTNKCVPSVLHTENNCYGKHHSECIDKCKWYGNVHTGKCYATFGSMKELKEEHEMVNKELKTFKNFIKMLNNKNKSLIFYIRQRINEININIDKLMKKKTGFKTNLRKIKRQNVLDNRLDTYKETTSKLGELKIEKENLKQILHNINNASQQPRSRSRSRGRGRGRSRRKNLFA
jgi:hypothetical protein